MTVIQAEGLNREELLDVAARLAEEEVTSAAEQLERLRARNRELETLVAELDAKVKELEFRNRYLAERLSPEDRVVDLINPNYPPAVGGEPGWEYHQTLTADLDGDGVDERVSVTTNAFWMPDEKEFGWDDGHPWHVYVEEPDGTRTYLFSNWVQLGRLDVILDREGPGCSSSTGGPRSGHLSCDLPGTGPVQDGAELRDPAQRLRHVGGHHDVLRLRGIRGYRQAHAPHRTSH